MAITWAMCAKGLNPCVPLLSCGGSGGVKCGHKIDFDFFFQHPPCGSGPIDTKNQTVA